MLQAAVIGYGNIGKRHASVIEAHPQFELAAICDIDPKKKSNNIPFFSSIEQLIQQQHVDLISICTPNYLHAYHTIVALNHHKHVLCEKPMCTTTEDAQKMIDAATNANKQLIIVKQNRFNQPVQYTKQLLKKGILGKINIVNINCYWNRNDNYYNSEWRGSRTKDGGCLYTQFSHFVDILYYLFGHCTPVFAAMTNTMHASINIEDNGTCTLHSTDGAIVNINYSTNSYKKNMEGSITILAEKGTIKIGGEYLNTIAYHEVENIPPPILQQIHTPNNYGSYQGSMSNHEQVYTNLYDTLQGTATPMTNMHEGRDVVKMIESIYAVSKF